MVDLTNKEVIHIKKDGIEYIQYRRLLEYEDILTHCFTLKPLNFRSTIGHEEISKNYELICNSLNIDKNNIVKPSQTHTNIVKAVEQLGENKYEDVDGLVTNKENIVLSLSFADCTPICLFDPIKKAIGNIHSGWRGTIGKIAQKGIEKMIDCYNCNPKDIICVIGPTIRKCHFEVEDDVKNKFLDQFGYMDGIIEKGEIKDNKQKYYIDTPKINKNMMLEMGVKEENIIDSEICTLCNENIIHSHRKERDLSGRNITLMMLKK